MKRILTAVIFLTATGAAGADDLWRTGDRVARAEEPALRALYDDAGAAFGRGDYAQAFRAYDYAAWQGSTAAALRLCVLDAYGLGTPPNPAKAAFWCARARAAGHGLAQVERYLGEPATAGR
jgi:TPR repeat protein